jgi:hypothetical protein
LGLILGLSLGLGIPVLLIAIGGTVFYMKKRRGSHEENTFDIPLASTGGRANSDSFRNSNIF